jgi:hypothetical protein
MLGNMLLEPDELVPTVIPDQTIRLRVAKITERTIELAWVEKKPTGMPAPTLVLPVDLRPYVRYKLPGQSAEKTLSEKTLKQKDVVLGTQFMPREDAGGTIGPKVSFTGAEAKANQEAVKAEASPTVIASLPNPPPTQMAIAKPTLTAPSKVGVTASDLLPQESEEWKRAVGFLNDLAKLEEPKK